MVPELRAAYNAAFTAEAYERMRRWLEAEGGSRVDFRISETPLFIPLELARELDRAAREICGQVMSPDYLAIADQIKGDFAIIPKHTIKSDEPILLDGMMFEDLKSKFPVPIYDLDINGLIEFLAAK